MMKYYSKFNIFSICMILSLIILFASMSHANSASTRHSKPKFNKKEESSGPTRSRQSKANTKNKSTELPKNFYERLGITKKATDKEIKKAYRKLAIKV